MVAVLALAFAGARAGSAVTTTSSAPSASTMTAADRGTPVATAAPLPDRPHLVDRRPDRGIDGLALTLAVLLVLGVAGRNRFGRCGAAHAVASAGPPAPTRAWHRRGPPQLLST